MNPIRIDNEIYYLKDSSHNMTDAQASLKDILTAIASIPLDHVPNVRSEILQELLELKTRSPYEFRLKRLIETGHLERREVSNRKLDALIAA
jgi:hypothetical protein